MTDRTPYNDGGSAEERLSRAGAPRPLPAQLRARLEEALVAGGTASKAVDVPPAARDRIEASLRRDGPSLRAGGVPTGSWARSSRVAVGAVAVSVAAAVTGLVVLGPGHVSTRTGYTATRSANGSDAHRFANQSGRPDGAAHAQKSIIPTSSARQQNLGGNNVGPASGVSGLKKSPVPVPAALPALTAPRVVAVTPASGPASGGNPVIVHGHNLGPSSQVLFGAVPGRSLQVVGDGELRVVAPVHAAGAVPVIVKTAAGLVSSVGGGATYTFLGSEG